MCYLFYCITYDSIFALPIRTFSRIILKSPGGAVAILDGLMLRETLPQEISVQTRIFGNPRTGNDEWANYIDSRIGVDNFSFVTNQNDIVPSLPPTALGYRHPSGEVHIESVNAEGQAEEVKQCEGQEDEECQDGNSFFAVSVSDHRGRPYFLLAGGLS